MSRNHNNRKNKKRKAQPQELSLTISEIGANGDGVAYHNDMRIFVPKTMAGDIVKARIEGGMIDGCHGRLLSIEEHSPNRKPAPCPHFENCGGCTLQHLGQEAYRNWKIARVQKTLERAGIKPEKWEEPIFLPAASRRRTTLAVHKLSDKKIKIGYHAPRSHDITDISECKILDPAVEELILNLKPYLLPLAPMRKSVDITVQKAGGMDVLLTGEWREEDDFTLAQHETIAAMMQTLNISRLSLRAHEHAPCETLITRKPVVKHFGALSVALPATAFLQASHQAEETLTDLAMDHICDEEKIADLFCGCGTFAGAMIKAGKTVTAIDGDHDAIEALSRANNENLTALRRNLFKEPLTTAELQDFDGVIFDPPRAGAKTQCENLAYSDVPKIIAISCNPATFARDARILTKDGDYRLKSIRIVDQFIWSAHTEIIALFEQ